MLKFIRLQLFRILCFCKVYLVNAFCSVTDSHPHHIEILLSHTHKRMFLEQLTTFVGLSKCYSRGGTFSRKIKNSWIAGKKSCEFMWQTHFFTQGPQIVSLSFLVNSKI
eukprot:Gb_27467 [translate_table: standard]